MERKEDAMANDDEFLTIGEARELLGVGHSTMTKLLKTGVLPTIGRDPLNQRTKLVRRSDVEALLRRSKKAAAVWSKHAAA
jgi:hypothetical protein